MHVKIVINRSFGGFSLSHAGMAAWARHAGVPLQWCHDRERGDDRAWHDIAVSPDNPRSLVVYRRADTGDFVFPSSLDRMDPALIATVEELGTAADGLTASLHVIEGTLTPIIEEHDGFETLHAFTLDPAF